MQVRDVGVAIHGADEDGDRVLVVTAEVEHEGAALEGATLWLTLLDAGGGLLREPFELDLGAVRPGRQLLVTRTWIRLVAPVVHARWSLRADEVAVRGPMRALAPDAAVAPPLSPSPPAPALSPPRAPAAPPPSVRPSQRPTGPADLPAPPPPPPPPATRWTRAMEGDAAVVAEEFVGTRLDMDGRDRVRELLRTGSPSQLVVACGICAVTGWRTAAQNIRRLLSHSEPEVRAAAAEAIGVLAGPAMEHYLRPLVQDRNADVRAAALTAIARLESP